MTVLYRGFIIGRSAARSLGEWFYCHDGGLSPGDLDNRCGYAATEDEARELIDDLLSAEAADRESA